MPAANENRLEGYLGRGALLSLLLHAQLFIPLIAVIFIYGGREEAQRAEEVDVAFRAADNEELPPDLPPLEAEAPPPAPSPPEPPERVKAEREKKRKDKDKPKDKPKPPAPKIAEKTKAKPEPEVPIPPMPPMPKAEPPPPPPEPKGHEKMVDLDNDKEVEPPPDAKYLAQKNNRAAVETRSNDTNLEKAQKGTESPSSPSERQDHEIGADKDKPKIAETEDVKSQLGKKAPQVTPHTDPALSQEEPPPAPTPKSLLALRDAARREHELTPETVNPSLPRAPDGNLALPDSRGVRGPRSDPARLSAGKRMKLQLSAKDYEYLFGADAEAERRLAQKERSTKVGRFQQRTARIKSALENFIPEVKPGNQTELNTRRAPFAAFIARMHRSIHKLWGFGQLEDWDEKSSSAPINNRNLLTTLELVLNADGTIDKVTVVKTSGLLEYDVAAIDVAYSAGPYPDPPREIRSKNGKIYVHWRFYRDERQCATSGVDYYILDNPPPGGDKGTPAVAEAGGGDATHGAPAPAAPAPAAAAPPIEERRPRQLERAPARDNPAQRAKPAQRTMTRRLGEEVAAAEENSAPHPPSAGTAGPPRAETPAARALAQSWFDAFAHGDVPGMLGKAAFPFRSTGGGAVASSRGELAGMLKALVDESPAGGRSVTAMQLYTAAALRAVIGRLPQGLDDGSGLLFALARTAGHDTLILILSEQKDGWKAAGLARR